jgi:hypothetical protein
MMAMYGCDVRHRREIPSKVPDQQMPFDGSDSADYLIGEWWHPTPSRPLHATRCVSIARSTGQRCRRWSTFGQSRCPKHSGFGLLRNSVEHREAVLERARLDLWGSTPYAVESLVELVTGSDVAPAVRLRACLEVLDRVGVRGTEAMPTDTPPKGEPAHADVIRERLVGLVGES